MSSPRASLVTNGGSEFPIAKELGQGLFQRNTGEVGVMYDPKGPVVLYVEDELLIAIGD